MILQALKEYYDRKAADPKSGIAPLGWERKEIPYLIVLSKQGEFLRLEVALSRTSRGKMPNMSLGFPLSRTRKTKCQKDIRPLWTG